MGDQILKKQPHYQGPGMDSFRSLAQKAEALASSRLNHIRERYDGLLDKLKTLQEEKYALGSVPVAKGDLLKAAKAELLKHQRNILIDEVLKPHLEECQQGKRPGPPLAPEMVSNASIFGNDFWAMFYRVITEADLEAAVAQLPDIGITDKERQTQCHKIEREMAAIQEAIEKEFAELETVQAPE